MLILIEWIWIAESVPVFPDYLFSASFFCWTSKKVIFLLRDIN